MKVVGAVERISRLSVDEFQSSFAAFNKPVIITNIVNEWQARTKSTPDAIKSLFGNMIVEVRDSDNEIDQFFGEGKRSHIRLEEYIDLISNPDSTRQRLPYLGNMSFNASSHLSTLKKYFQFPRYFPNQILEEMRLWIGAPGQISTIHNDNYHNFNAQLYGRKTFLLFPPEQHRLLYTQLMNRTCWASPINPHQPDIDKYPLFALAEALEACLEDGDLLYIPIFWWHQATALTLSINVNLFCIPSETEFWSQE
jgi:jumonji domain-containing protein 7